MQDSQRNILVFINPISGTSQKNQVPEMIRMILSKHQIPFTILPTSPNGQYQYLVSKIMEESITDIIICGGDGTVNQIIAACRALPVRFGIIPMGSGNGLAFAAGIPADGQQALELIVRGKTAATDAFWVNEAFACMLCGVGFDAWVAHEFAKQEKRGLLTYTQTSLKHFWNANPYSFSLELNDQWWDVDAYFISMANANQFGNHFTIAPQASLHDGLLDIVVFGNMNKALIPFALLQQVSIGKPGEIDNQKKSAIQYFQTSSLQIINKDLAPIHIDGEPRETNNRLTINVIPSAFQLFVP
jgi:YegS/Rv2252/BmrU family lipid kinase